MLSGRGGSARSPNQHRSRWRRRQEGVVNLYYFNTMGLFRDSFQAINGSFVLLPSPRQLAELYMCISFCLCINKQEGSPAPAAFRLPPPPPPPPLHPLFLPTFQHPLPQEKKKKSNKISKISNRFKGQKILSFRFSYSEDCKILCSASFYEWLPGSRDICLLYCGSIRG